MRRPLKLYHPHVAGPVGRTAIGQSWQLRRKIAQQGRRVTKRLFVTHPLSGLWHSVFRRPCLAVACTCHRMVTDAPLDFCRLPVRYNQAQIEHLLSAL